MHPPPRALRERPIRSLAWDGDARMRASCQIYPYGYVTRPGYRPGLQSRKYPWGYIRVIEAARAMISPRRHVVAAASADRRIRAPARARAAAESITSPCLRWTPGSGEGKEEPFKLGAVVLGGAIVAVEGALQQAGRDDLEPGPVERPGGR